MMVNVTLKGWHSQKSYVQVDAYSFNSILFTVVYAKVLHGYLSLINFCLPLLSYGGTYCAGNPCSSGISYLIALSPRPPALGNGGRPSFPSTPATPPSLK